MQIGRDGSSGENHLRKARENDTVQGVPVAIRWLPHLIRVHPMLKAYLSSVVQEFEWYAKRGEPVPRNQFGSHPWLSETGKSPSSANTPNSPTSRPSQDGSS